MCSYRPRRLLACSWLLVAWPVLAQTPTPTGGSERDVELATVRGCLSGSALKHAHVDFETAPATFPVHDVYRLKGSKDVRRRIKEAKDAYVEVRGRVKPGPKPVTLGTKVGGASIGLGAPPGSTRPIDQRTPQVPVLEVETIVVLDKTCEAAAKPRDR